MHPYFSIEKRQISISPKAECEYRIKRKKKLLRRLCCLTYFCKRVIQELSHQGPTAFWAAINLGFTVCLPGQ